MTIDRAAWPFVAICAALTVAAGFASSGLAVAGAMLTVGCALFFRDPQRVTPQRNGLVVSAADGMVCKIDAAVPPPELGMGDASRPRVCVFMNVFDVHVNRVPCAGTIVDIAYRKGLFVNASLDKASEGNERNGVRVRLDDGRDLAFVQIAGLIARRIRCDIAIGQRVKTGSRMGLIRFGSRVDHYLPEGTSPLVLVGQRTVAGETVIADLAPPPSGNAAA